MSRLFCPRVPLCALVAVLAVSNVTRAQVPPGTAFTYQGHLKNAGSPVNGNVNLAFFLYNAATGGTQVGSPVIVSNQSVENGLFTAVLNAAGQFGASAFNGERRWLEIWVNGVPLSPRQEVTATPNAIFALNGDRLDGLDSTAFLQTISGIPAGGDLSGAYPSPTVARLQARPVSAAAPASNQVLKWNGSAWEPGNDDTGGAGYWVANGADIFNTNITGNVIMVDGGLGGNGAVGIGTQNPSDSTKLDVWTNNRPWAITALIPSAGPGGGAAIEGDNFSSSGGYGVAGYSSTGRGVYGNHTNSSGVGYGVRGRTASTSGFGVYSDGNMHVNGTLSKSGGAFKIDHPLDPANKYLYHSFVESPDMMNIYNGNVVTDADGYATIQLPTWFQGLNRDFRYQLTVIGEFAQAIVAREIDNNSFVIRTDKPRVKVSWQVTGIRQDPYAEAHRIPVEEDKPANDRGKYQHPELYGQPPEMGMNYDVQRERPSHDRPSPASPDGRADETRMENRP